MRIIRKSYEVGSDIIPPIYRIIKKIYQDDTFLFFCFKRELTDKDWIKFDSQKTEHEAIISCQADLARYPVKEIEIFFDTLTKKEN